MNISKRTMEMLSRAHMYAASFNLNFIGTEHILLALSDASMTPVDEILSRYGVGQNIVMVVAMVAYTLANYVYNRFVTFRVDPKGTPEK